jgi:hypothetical protein
VNKNAVNGMIDLVLAYWTPERKELWKEYQGSDKSLNWRSFEKKNRNKKRLS